MPSTKKEVQAKLAELTTLVNDLPPDGDGPKPPVPPTDEELATVIRDEFLRRTIPRGYSQVDGWPRDSIASWVKALRDTLNAGGTVTDLYPTIDKDVEQWWPVKNNPVDPPVVPPDNKDEVLTLALVKSWMNARLGHEVLPSIYEDFPEWGIFSNVIMSPEANTNPAYPSVPATVSTRHRIMGWAVFAGINRRPNRSANTKLHIARAVTLAVDFNGRVSKVEGWNGDVLTPNTDMIYGNVKVPFVPGTRDVAGLGRQDEPWAHRNFHPTSNELTPAGGGELRSKVRGTMTIYVAQALPIDARRAMDFDQFNCSGYAGQDNYGNGPRQDGISGRFLQVMPYKRHFGTYRASDADIQLMIAEFLRG